jgi:tetratricopeptide (TPR) repeat protein
MTHRPQSRLLVLGVDGLDWTLLHRLVDAGQMPFVTQLMEAGASGPMRVPAPAGACAQWTTLATGTCADEHGVLDDLWVRADGIRSSRVGGAQRRRPTFWELAAAQGRRVRVAAWPAATGAAAGPLGALPEEAASRLQIVGEGFERAEHASEACWPMAPGCVEPSDLRALVDEARVHPDDLAVALAQPLVPAARPGEANALLRPARWQLARWSSVHNLGVHWASQGDDALMVLRLDGLPEWLNRLRRHAPEQPVEVGLAPWYRYLDLLLGRYMALLGRQAHLALLSNAGLPAALTGSGAGQLFHADGPGGLLLAGPGVPPDSLLESVNGLDVAPTLAALLNLTHRPAWPGRDLLARRSGPFEAQRQRYSTLTGPALRLEDLIEPSQRDEAALAWLCAQGCPAPATAELERGSLPPRMKRLKAWAAVRRLRGDAEGAVAALQSVLQLLPQDLEARVTLCLLLLEAGRCSECEALARDLPPQVYQGIWADVVQALIGCAAQDWPRATPALLRLVAAGAAPLNAPAWLGWAELQQQHWGDAHTWFETALTWPGDAARVHEGLGLAWQGLGRLAEAEQAFSAAIAEQPDNARLHLLRAQARLAGGHHDHAESGCRRALTLDNAVPGGYALLARITLARAAQVA